MTMGNASKILRRCLVGLALITGACVVLVMIYFVVAFGVIGYRMEWSEPYDPMEHILAAAPEWTPDGSRIIFGHWGGIYAVNQDGSTLNRIHGSGSFGGNDLYHTPDIYGDGSRIAYSKYQGDERWERLSSTLDGADVRETSENFDREGFNYLSSFGSYRGGFNRGARVSFYSISPDKSRIAFVELKTNEVNGEQVRALYVSENPREADVSGWTELAEGDAIHSPRWSPDGSQLAFVKISRVPSDNVSHLYKTQVVSLSGSDFDTVHQGADGPGGYFDSSSGKYVAGYVDSPYGFYDAAWSPDGAKLLISDSSSISVVNADGSDLRTLMQLDPLLPISQLHPSWSPDGSKIAVYNGNADPRTLFVVGALFTMSSDGSNKRVLVEYVSSYKNPLRLAQDQSWDPAYDFPTPTPAPTATPTPAPSATPKPSTATPSPTTKPSAPVSTPTPSARTDRGNSSLTRADAPDGTKDPRMGRDVGGFDPTAPIRGGAAYGRTHVSSLEDVLARGLFAAGASPSHIAFRGTADANSVRCDWRGKAMTLAQREAAIRFWLGMDDDPLPSPAEVERRFMSYIDGMSPKYQDFVAASYIPLARGGLSNDLPVLVCCADYTVHEYLLGSGSTSEKITVAYDRAMEARSHGLYALSHEDTDITPPFPISLRSFAPSRQIPASAPP